MTLHTSFCIALRIWSRTMYVESQWSNSQYLESAKRHVYGHIPGGIVLIRLIEVGSLNVRGTFWWQVDKRGSKEKSYHFSLVASHLAGQSSYPACDFLSSVAVTATTTELLPW
jgi:hypothetical protein